MPTIKEVIEANDVRVGVNEHLDEIKIDSYGGSTFALNREQARALSVVLDHFVIKGKLFEFADGGKIKIDSKDGETRPVNLQYENGFSCLLFEFAHERGFELEDAQDDGRVRFRRYGETYWSYARPNVAAKAIEQNKTRGEI